jgi:hypothetical protein
VALAKILVNRRTGVLPCAGSIEEQPTPRRLFFSSNINFRKAFARMPHGWIDTIASMIFHAVAGFTRIDLRRARVSDEIFSAIDARHARHSCSAHADHILFIDFVIAGERS